MEREHGRIGETNNLKSRYKIDLRTTTADPKKLVKEEIDKYARFTLQDLGWKSQYRSN